jgi:FK506-binding protein 8
LKRLRGNWWFERKETYNALLCYQKALAFISIENLHEDTCVDKDLEELSALSLIIRNNMAAALILLEFYDEALDNVSYVLTHQPNNIKALYRKGNEYCLNFFFFLINGYIF